MSIDTIIDVKTYPLDLTGELKSNQVTERHTLTTLNDESFHVIIPRAAPFFFKSNQWNSLHLEVNVTIRHVETNRQLVYGRDYTVAHVVPGLARYTKHNQSVYGAIVIYGYQSQSPYLSTEQEKRSLSGGTYEITYQTIGGDYVLSETDYIEAVKRAATKELTVSWDQILDRPTVFPPAPHHHAVDDFSVQHHDIVNELRSMTIAVNSIAMMNETRMAVDPYQYQHEINYPILVAMKKLVEENQQLRGKIHHLELKHETYVDAINRLSENMKVLIEQFNVQFPGLVEQAIERNRGTDTESYYRIMPRLPELGGNP